MVAQDQVGPLGRNPLKLVMEQRLEGRTVYWEVTIDVLCAEALVTESLDVHENRWSTKASMKRLRAKPERLGREVMPGVFLAE